VRNHEDAVSLLVGDVDDVQISSLAASLAIGFVWRGRPVTLASFGELPILTLASFGTDGPDALASFGRLPILPLASFGADDWIALASFGKLPILPLASFGTEDRSHWLRLENCPSCHWLRLARTARRIGFVWKVAHLAIGFVWYGRPVALASFGKLPILPLASFGTEDRVALASFEELPILPLGSSENRGRHDCNHASSAPPGPRPIFMGWGEHSDGHDCSFGTARRGLRVVPSYHWVRGSCPPIVSPPPQSLPPGRVPERGCELALKGMPAHPSSPVRDRSRAAANILGT
jgi:hypothetical protein